jgi:hypothetical protein
MKKQQKSSSIEALRLLTSYRRQDSEYAKNVSEVNPLFFTIPETTSIELSRETMPDTILYPISSIDTKTC